MGFGRHLLVILKNTQKNTKNSRNTKNSLGPFLIQSDSASRKRPFSTGLFFDWIRLVLLIVSRVDFKVLVLFPEAVGVREYCCMALETRLAALCFASSSRATRASRATNLVQAGWWRWAQPKAANAKFVRCNQPRTAKATAGVAVVGKMTSITRATAVV